MLPPGVAPPAGTKGAAPEVVAGPPPPAPAAPAAPGAPGAPAAPSTKEGSSAAGDLELWKLKETPAAENLQGRLCHLGRSLRWDVNAQ